MEKKHGTLSKEMVFQCQHKFLFRISICYNPCLGVGGVVLGEKIPQPIPNFIVRFFSDFSPHSI